MHEDRSTKAELAQPSAWHLADKAYQLHHNTCGHCIAAGKDPTQQGCPTGAALWAAYQEAGLPSFLGGPRA